MKAAGRLIFLIGLTFLLGVAVLTSACADEDEYDSKRGLGTVDNPTYKEQCGACHFAYQPALLPSGSWHKILSSLDYHNGEEIVIEEEIRTKILIAKEGGGYIYHSDHSVPANVSFEQYQRVIDLVLRYGTY